MHIKLCHWHLCTFHERRSYEEQLQALIVLPAEAQGYYTCPTQREKKAF